MRLKEICPAIRADVIKRVQDEWRLARRVQRINFPVAGRFSITGYAVYFYPEKKTEAHKLALAVGKRFGVKKWKKTFSEWGGDWSYKADVKMNGNIKHEIALNVDNATSSKGCRIVEKTSLVTKYESICNGEKEVK